MVIKLISSKMFLWTGYQDTAKAEEVSSMGRFEVISQLLAEVFLTGTIAITGS